MKTSSDKYVTYVECKYYINLKIAIIKNKKDSNVNLFNNNEYNLNYYYSNNSNDRNDRNDKNDRNDIKNTNIIESLYRNSQKSLVNKKVNFVFQWLPDQSK